MDSYTIGFCHLKGNWDKVLVYRGYRIVLYSPAFLLGDIRKSFLQKTEAGGHQYEQDKCTVFGWSTANADWQIRRNFCMFFYLDILA